MPGASEIRLSSPDGTMLTLCPINHNVGYTDTCPARQCQYNWQGVCRHKEMTSTDPADFLNSEEVMERATQASRRIKAYVYLDQYVMHTLNKSLLQVTKEELHSLIDEKRFYSWPHARKDTFWVVESIYTEMFVPKKIKRKNMVDHVGLNASFRKQVENALTLKI